MTYLLLSCLYQGFAHYFDWRHLFRSQPPQPVFLMLNYVIGCTGIALAYLGWMTTALEAPTAQSWLLLPQCEARWMFILVLGTNGLTVLLCYLLDALVLNRNRAKDSADQIALLTQQVSRLEEMIDAKTPGA